jgi:hypothetical protein
MRDTAHAVAHEALLARALHAEVADMHPRPLLDEILDAAPHRSWLCLWVLAATVGALLILAALLLAASHRQPTPTTTVPSRLLEA